MRLGLLVAVFLSFRIAGAFLGTHPSRGGLLLHRPATSPRHSSSHYHDTAMFIPLPLDHHHEQQRQSSRAIFWRSASGGRHLCRAPRLAASGGEESGGESGEPADGGIDEETSIQDGDVVPGEVDPSAGSAGGGVAASAGQEAPEGDKGAGSDAEEEQEGETVYLPSGDNKDFRLFRARLRAGSDENWQKQLGRNVNEAQLGGQEAWAHEVTGPEKGSLIVAKSTEFTMSQTYFNEAVILLASHDEAGSAGFILNRPTSVCLGDLVEGDALPQFRETPLYLGGDVGEGNVQILHPFGPDELSGAMEIIPGVYIGGAVDDADRMVASGKAKRDDFRFFLHLCGWGPGQLEAEIERGVWLSAATSTNVIMKHCLGLPVPLWREVMTLMGPKFGLLARDTYDDL